MTAPSPRLRVAVLFGGRSAEHDVSLLSAANVLRALDPLRYDVSLLSAANVLRALDPLRYDAVPIYVTSDGRWLLGRSADAVAPADAAEVCLVPGGRGRILALPPASTPVELPRVDILFPVLHGQHGEDGSVQGVAEVARVPLAGCGIVGSAIALDKDLAKRLLAAAGLPVARAVALRADALPPADHIEREIGFPLFVKPARQGSSVSVCRVSGPEELAPALADGFRHDDRLLAEQFIAGREIEFSVLEGADGSLFVSRPGEIVPAARHGFYTYEAKYIDGGGAALKVPAELPPAVEAALRDAAADAFRALGCDGMARVDFFLAENGRYFVNELNTIPGFTDVSMYARAMAASGVPYPAVLDRLIAHGLARADQQAAL